MRTFQFKALSKPIFNSRIKTDEVKNKERWLGYFMGPALVACCGGAVGGSYLNSFYTDVLHLNAFAAGAFLALMPIISKIIDALTNLLMGRIVDNTKSRQGKARPWILISGPMLMLSTVLLFAVPRSTPVVQAIWVAFSYNLYYSISYTMYNLSNVITIPLSTRDNKKRDTLAMIQSMGINMVSGLVLAVVFPSFVLPFIGVNQDRWVLAMTVISLLALLGTMLQYFFIKERVTEEVQEQAENKQTKQVSLLEQFKGCCSSKYWMMAIGIFVLQYLCSTSIGVNCMLYYSNWVVGSYNDGVTLSLLNIIGQAMLGPGIVIMWPLVKKFGKQKVFILCGIIAVAGGTFGLLNATNLSSALIALTIRSIGALPYTYVLVSILADALDHVEWKCGYRCDGFSSAIYSIIITVTAGLGLGIINLGLSATGYVAPALDGSWVEQSQTVKNFLTFGMFGVPMIGVFVSTVLFFFFDLEKKLPGIHADLEKRKSESAEESMKTEALRQ
jgi:GPH family glycoside/pentoside/hexuronide:cation symporter